MTSMLYAAYGSNLHPERLRRRAPSAKLLGTAVVMGKALRFHKRGRDGSGKCNIVAVTAGEIYVAVYRIPAPEKPDLDAAESVGYRIDALEVPEYGECFTYVAAESHVDQSLRPFSWYRELVVVGCEYLQFPKHYLDGIGAVPALEDPDSTRHARQMEIVERARAQSRRSP